jgi:Winged helix-turn helix
VPVVSMSKKEFDRLEVLLGVRSGRLRVADACELLGLKRRQVFRLLAGLKHGGAASLVSRRRGRPSNNRLPEAYRDLALSLVRERYADFGPTLAAEKLAEVHGCAISRETLRGWMIATPQVSGSTAAIVCPARISRAAGAIALASWCRSTDRNTRGLRIARRSARCWRSLTMRQAD